MVIMQMYSTNGSVPSANLPSIKIMEKKEYQLKVREHSRNMQMLSSRQASTNRLQEIRPRNAIFIVLVRPASLFDTDSQYSTAHKYSLD